MPIERIIFIVLSVILGILIVDFLVWAFLAAPRLSHKRMAKYRNLYYAHRGLHGEGACENSLSAFERAVAAGYGIELDVRLSGSGELVVFHDANAIRVTGVDKKIADMSLDELRGLRLGATDDSVPTFREVLSLVNGKVPLLIEIKLGEGESGVAEAFLREIEGYTGEFIVESFNPRALAAVKKQRPDIPIGILSLEYTREERFRGKFIYRLGEKLRLNFMFRPDFIAYDQKGYRVLSLRMLRKIFRVPTIAWTIRSVDEERAARAHGFEGIIFEGYIPK